MILVSQKVKLAHIILLLIAFHFQPKRIEFLVFSDLLKLIMMSSSNRKAIPMSEYDHVIAEVLNPEANVKTDLFWQSIVCITTNPSLNSFKLPILPKSIQGILKGDEAKPASCGGCHKLNAQFVCTRCYVVKYCSNDCLETHCSYHEESCKSICKKRAEVKVMETDKMDSFERLVMSK